MADKKLKKIKLPDEQQYEIDAKYWGGYETSDIKTIDGVSIFGGGNIELSNNQISVSYNELVTLRTNSQLIPGQQYRITDYTCTTTQDGTKSAGHVFDIIVTADDKSTLNEVARSALHEGDSYFNGCDLNAWKIWYSLDNDTDRFAWADNTNGKGVIYRMIDEFNNDCPYDFKNIQFHRQWDEDKQLWSIISSIKNRWIIIPPDGESTPCYTFSSAGDSSTTEFTDMSLVSSNNVYSNVIKEYYYIGKLTLNNNCFFGNNCNSNTFGNNCNSNTFGNDCDNNTFGSDCYNNTFGNYCGSNTFGNYYGYSSFGNDCGNNTFGSDCVSNTFGNSCGHNTFGNRCEHIFFGNNCYNNSFGNECDDNSFGNYCQNNSFGNNCCSNSFGNNCCSNSFGNNCAFIKFASNSSASTKYDYYQNNHFGDGCMHILFTGTETASSNAQVQNYNFAQGLRGTGASSASSAYLTIGGVRGISFETKVAKNSAGELKVYCEADLIK